MALETVKEDEEVYRWREVQLLQIAELEREKLVRRRGRDIVLAVDHGPNSKHAFDWALIHFCRLADTIHLVHAVSNVKNEIVYNASEGLMQKLAMEAFEVAMVRTSARIVEGDPGKVICKEAERVKPAAVILGTRGRGFIQSVLQGSVSEYCMRNCKSSPVVIVPGKEAGDESMIYVLGVGNVRMGHGLGDGGFVGSWVESEAISVEGVGEVGSVVVGGWTGEVAAWEEGVEVEVGEVAVWEGGVVSTGGG
ncbi:hypothetical protein D8674_026153 [Pyrus ussuriensis x Pyrus communis]|uniref:UspA domain-containing protein n=1 Tax=Pyrus ussuriensis x Pyrus communis TaxID=2448454 RepID=A0A5N5I7B5_9ROSA|nr:hypothetical protein D8674_026153 [Pyrus ussuriensis x Pyrus communis]